MKKFCIVILIPALMCVAQTGRHLRGEIHSETPAELSWLTVKIEEPTSRQNAEVTYVNVAGEFEFRNIPEGTYTLRVIDHRGNEVTSQPLSVGPANSITIVQLPAVPEARPTGETTSIARLQHRPSKRALDDGRKAQKFAESGDYGRAAIEWKKAVEADPDFSEAHGNLGAQYSRLGRAAEAVAEFERAIVLDPSTAQHQSNLAVALAQLGRLMEAELWARRAVQLEGSNALGHYVLGCILGANAAKLPEAIQQLQVASRQIPRAHEKLANIYHELGKLEVAWQEMNQYLESRAPGGAPQTKTWASPLW